MRSVLRSPLQNAESQEASALIEDGTSPSDVVFMMRPALFLRGPPHHSLFLPLQDAEAQEEGALVAFWEAAGGSAGDIEAGVCTPCQVPNDSIAQRQHRH